MLTNINHNITIITYGHHTRCYIVEATIKISIGLLMNLIIVIGLNEIHE